MKKFLVIDDEGLLILLPILAFFLLESHWLLVLAITISIMLIMKKKECRQASFQLDCLRHKATKHLLRDLWPIKEITETTNIDRKLRVKRENACLKAEKSGLQRLSFLETRGYVIFDDHSYEQSTYENSIEDTIKQHCYKKPQYIVLTHSKGTAFKEDTIEAIAVEVQELHD